MLNAQEYKPKVAAGSCLQFPDIAELASQSHGQEPRLRPKPSLLAVA